MLHTSPMGTSLAKIVSPFARSVLSAIADSHAGRPFFAMSDSVIAVLEKKKRKRALHGSKLVCYGHVRLGTPWIIFETPEHSR